MNSVKFFAISIATAFINAIPSLILGAIYPVLGAIISIAMTVSDIYLVLKKDGTLFFSSGIPSILATIIVTFTMMGIDATWLITIGVIYCCIWMVSEYFAEFITKLFGR